MFGVGLAIGILAIGILVGFTFGVLVMSWLCAARHADDAMERD